MARPAPRLALFDLDNTLLAGDSDHAWGEFLISRGTVDEVEHRATNEAFYVSCSFLLFYFSFSNFLFIWYFYLFVLLITSLEALFILLLLT